MARPNHNERNPNRGSSRIANKSLMGGDDDHSFDTSIEKLPQGSFKLSF